MQKINIKNSNGVKLIYCTSIAFSDKLAHRVQIAAMAREFQKKLGENFYLGVNYINQDDKNIKIVCFNDAKSYSLSWKYLKFIKKNKIDFVYCREAKLLFFIFLYNKFFFRNKSRFIYEIHSLAEKNVLDKILNRLFCFWVDKYVFITNELKNIYFEKYSYDLKKGIVFPDAVDLARFNIDVSKEDARQKLDLPQDKKIIAYAGSFLLHSWKGIDILLKSAKQFSDDFLFVFVGGTKKEIANIRSQYPSDNVLLIVQKPNSQIPLYLKAADVLVLPNKKGEDISEKYTSPLKMFEYMASRRPIVASNLPSIREILNDQNSILVQPNEPQKLAQGIKEAMAPEVSEKISQQAFQDVRNYTWEKRVDEILKFIQM